MKTLHIVIIIIFVIAAHGAGIAHGELVPKTLANLYLEYQGKLIVRGQVMSVSENTAKNLTSYDIKIFDYVTRPQQASVITASAHIENKTIPVFDVGDNVQLYLDKGLTGYEISPYSFKMDKKCSTWFGPSHLDFEPPHSAPASSTRFLDVNGSSINPSLDHEFVLATDGVYTPLDSLGFEVYVGLNDNLNPIFHDTKQFNVQPCTYAAPTWKYTPTEDGNYTIYYKVIGGIYQDKIILDNASMTTGFTIEKSNVQSSKNATNFIGNDLTPILPPLKQFKSGIAADDVKCQQGLQLVIKAKDGSPACTKPQTAQKLVEHKWGWAMQSIDSIKPLLSNRIIGLENDIGVVIFGNQTYYFVTPIYTDAAYSNPVQISFHDVVFTLFPPGFRGGLPSGSCASDIVGQKVAGGGQYYWADAKFSDGVHELLHIFADSQPCPIYPKQTHFSNHANPQAGLTFYDGKMKLLVSVDNPVSSLTNYTKESEVAGDATYLSQTVNEWKSKTPEQLNAYYKKYKDVFYTELGSFLIKDEMKKELERQKIQNMRDDFKVFPGMSLDSLPPHIGYDAVVNATDGNSYLLLGGVFANKVESVAIKKLVFDKDVLDSLSTGKKPSFTNTFERSPKVVISEQSGTNPIVVPYNLALDLDKGNLVTFYNNLTVPIRIQPYGSGLVVDEGGLGWKSKVFESNETMTVQFNRTGYYEWNARSPPQGTENWWDFHGSGQIAVFSLNHDDSASGDKLKMAQVFVSNSDIPWSSTGLDIHGNLEISLYESVYHMIPDAQKYYLSRAMQLIPFDVPVVISSPSFTEK